MSIQTARTLRKNMTDAERLLWKHLRSNQAGGCKFRRQHPIGSFIVDFICIEKKLIIEVDGGHHALQVYEDEERTNYLQKDIACYDSGIMKFCRILNWS